MASSSISIRPTRFCANAWPTNSMATPQDYLEKFRAGVEKVTEADVARAASKYLHKEKLAILVVGNPPEFDKPLSSLGPVTNIDITIPPPPGGPPAAAKPAQ